jgi:hypothetical protein
MTESTRPRLYRNWTPRLHGNAWAGMDPRAEPAMLDCGADRFLSVRNGGPANVYLSAGENVTAPETTLRAPTATLPGEEIVIRSRVFLRSAGESQLAVHEYFGDPDGRVPVFGADHATSI